MKILIRNADNVVIYARADLALDSEAHGEGWRDPNFSMENARMDDATLPDNWTGGVWAYSDGVWTVMDVARNAEIIAANLQIKRESLVATPWQARKAINATGFRDSVEAGVAVSDQSTKDAWEFAQEFKRLDPLVIGLGMMLGKTEAELDALFELAVSL